MTVFKATNGQMECTLGKGTFAYRLGVPAYADGSRCGGTGLHACEYVADCLQYYGLGTGNRFFRAEASGDIAEEAYRETYGMQPPQEEEPEMAEVAPVQPSDGRRKETKRKESKVIKAAGVKEAAHAGEAPDVEEQLPGQMNVGDYPGVVPEEDCPVSTYTVMEDGTAGQEPEETKQTGPEGQIPQECGPLSGDAAPEDTEGIWMGIYKSHAELSKYLTVWEPQRALMEPDMVNRLYNMAVDMAAGFERLLLGRGGNG